MSLCLSSTQLWLSYSLRLPVSGSKGLNGHLTNSIQSKWNCCLVRELSKSKRWDYPGRWWVKLSKKKSNSATGFQPTHTLPILLYTSPGTSCLQISKAHRLSLRESECVPFVLSATVSLWMLIWLCLLLFMIVAVNAFPGGYVCASVSKCVPEREGDSPDGHDRWGGSGSARSLCHLRATRVYRGDARRSIRWQRLLCFDLVARRSTTEKSIDYN